MTSSTTTITVLGAGYVGLTTAALLAHAGYKVYALEPNPQRLNVIKQGKSFFFEEGLDAIIKATIEQGTLIPTDSYADSVPHSHIVFSSVGTPDNPDGSSNLTYVFAAAREAAAHLAPGSIYVQKSTVPVGTGARIEALFSELGVTLHYVSNPEFLREGTALHDTLYFDRVVAGGNDPQATSEVLAVYRQLETWRDVIASAAGIKPASQKGHYISTSLSSAELIKVTANAFLALKISFANSIAKLSDEVGADIVDVMDAVGADKRIGRAFLNAGRGYGGGCFPKDVSGLIASGLDHGIELEIMHAAQAVNTSMPGYIVEKLLAHFEGDLAGKRVAVLGLAFKAGTSDVRRSPGITLANAVLRTGAQVTAYDPEAHGEAEEELHDGIVQFDSLETAVSGADAVIIATEWPEILHFSAKSYAAAMHGTVFVDAINRFDIANVEHAGLHYIGVGR